jgi:hypothetical protein
MAGFFNVYASAWLFITGVSVFSWRLRFFSATGVAQAWSFAACWTRCSATRHKIRTLLKAQGAAPGGQL